MQGVGAQKGDPHVEREEAPIGALVLPRFVDVQSLACEHPLEVIGCPQSQRALTDYTSRRVAADWFLVPILPGLLRCLVRHLPGLVIG